MRKYFIYVFILLLITNFSINLSAVGNDGDIGRATLIQPEGTSEAAIEPTEENTKIPNKRGKKFLGFWSSILMGKDLVSFSFGPRLMYFLKPNLGITIDLGYNLFGYEPLEGSDTRISMHALNLSGMATYRSGGFFLGAGIDFLFILASKYNVDNSEEFDEDLNNWFNKVQFGLAFTIGGYWGRKFKFGIAFDCRFYLTEYTNGVYYTTKIGQELKMVKNLATFYLKIGMGF